MITATRTGSAPNPNPNPAPAPTHSGEAAGSSLRKAAILVVSLEQTLAASLLERLDRAAVEAVTLEMARLERIDPEEQRAVLDEFYALGLKRLRFLFDDLARLEPEAIRTAYDDEDASTWVLALAGAARPMQAMVLDVLPPQTAQKLRRQLEQLGPFRLADAEAAQAAIAERVRRLHDYGRITLPEPDGQEDSLV